MCSSDLNNSCTLYNKVNSVNWCLKYTTWKGSEEMATSMKRFTISVTDDMDRKLDRMKQVKYYNTTRNKMIQDLIMLGLETMSKEMKKEGGG